MRVCSAKNFGFTPVLEEPNLDFATTAAVAVANTTAADQSCRRIETLEDEESKITLRKALSSQKRSHSLRSEQDGNSLMSLISDYSDDSSEMGLSPV